MMKSNRRRQFLLSLAPALLIFTLGCNKAPDVGTAAGSVKLKGGEPITEGIVNFYSKERGIGGTGNLDAQGAFRLTEPLPIGSYTVFIPPPLPDAPMPGVTTSTAASFAVPAKYHTEMTSDLVAEVKGGENSYTFELDAK